MKIFTQAFFLFLFSTFAMSLFAQSNCGNTLPVLQCPADNTVCIDEILAAPIVTTASNLPDLEYAIIDYNTLSTSGTGPAIVGIDQDGIFAPFDYGLMPGGSFGVIPVAYDLAQIQETIDDILLGEVVIIFFPTSCCDLAVTAGTDICTPFNDAGIFSGSDVTSLEGATSLFPATGNLSTIEEFTANLDTLNMTLADPQVPTECGGGDVFCYAYGMDCIYDIVPDTLFVTAPHMMNELVEVEDLLSSTASVASPNVVTYNANICIELTGGFEAQIGSEFTAEIEDPCN